MRLGFIIFMFQEYNPFIRLFFFFQVDPYCARYIPFFLCYDSVWRCLYDRNTTLCSLRLLSSCGQVGRADKRRNRDGSALGSGREGRAFCILAARKIIRQRRSDSRDHRETSIKKTRIIALKEVLLVP